MHRFDLISPSADFSAGPIEINMVLSCIINYCGFKKLIAESNRSSNLNVHIQTWKSPLVKISFNVAKGVEDDLISKIKLKMKHPFNI